jgi:hypothetical protein
MSAFDSRKLSHRERVAWIEYLKDNGPNELAGLFETQLRAASMLRNEGKSSAEIAALIMGDYHDADHLTIGGTVVRHQSIVLLAAMVRQVIELVPETTSSAVDGGAANHLLPTLIQWERGVISKRADGIPMVERKK